MNACPLCGNMSSDEETACGVCGGSFSEVPDRIREEGVFGKARRPDERRAVNHAGLVKLGVWLALVLSGLGLVLFTFTNVARYGSYNYKFGAGALWAAGFALGIILIMFAIAWASVRLRP